METKVCKKCGEARPILEFVKNKRCSNGFAGTCLVCERINSAKFRERNSEKIALAKKKWYAKNKEKEKERVKAWNAKNKEKRKAQIKEWRLKNKTKILEYNRAYIISWRRGKQQFKDEKYYAYARNMAARKRELLPSGYVKQMLEVQGFPKESITKELIDVKRILIKTKRLCRTSKN